VSGIVIASVGWADASVDSDLRKQKGLVGVKLEAELYLSALSDSHRKATLKALQKGYAGAERAVSTKIYKTLCNAVGAYPQVRSPRGPWQLPIAHERAEEAKEALKALFALLFITPNKGMYGRTTSHYWTSQIVVLKGGAHATLCFEMPEKQQDAVLNVIEPYILVSSPESISTGVMHVNNGKTIIVRTSKDIRPS
jgi:hypothetical protein